eukprot:gene32782-33846_t
MTHVSIDGERHALQGPNAQFPINRLRAVRVALYFALEGALPKSKLDEAVYDTKYEPLLRSVTRALAVITEEKLNIFKPDGVGMEPFMKAVVDRLLDKVALILKDLDLGLMLVELKVLMRLDFTNDMKAAMSSMGRAIASATGRTLIEAIRLAGASTTHLQPNDAHSAESMLTALLLHSKTQFGLELMGNLSEDWKEYMNLIGSGQQGAAQPPFNEQDVQGVGRLLATAFQDHNIWKLTKILVIINPISGSLAIIPTHGGTFKSTVQGKKAKEFMNTAVVLQFPQVPLDLFADPNVAVIWAQSDNTHGNAAKVVAIFTDDRDMKKPTTRAAVHLISQQFGVPPEIVFADGLLQTALTGSQLETEVSNSQQETAVSGSQQETAVNSNQGQKAGQNKPLEDRMMGLTSKIKARNKGTSFKHYNLHLRSMVRDIVENKELYAKYTTDEERDLFGVAADFIMTATKFLFFIRSFDRGDHQRCMRYNALASFNYPPTEKCVVEDRDMECMGICLFKTKEGDGDKQYVSCLPRHRHILLCPCFHLVLYIFLDLCIIGSHIGVFEDEDEGGPRECPGRGIPDVESGEKDYWDHPLFHAANPLKQLSPATHTADIRKLLAVADHGCSKVVHYARATGCLQQKMTYGTDTSELRQQGNWSRKVFDSEYCQLISPAAASNAGGQVSREAYYLPSNDLMPDDIAGKFGEAFSSMVAQWPLQHAQGMYDRVLMANKAKLVKNSRDPTADLPGQAMLRALAGICGKVFFQSFPALWELNSGHLIFSHPFFEKHREAWAEWCKLQLAYCEHMTNKQQKDRTDHGFEQGLQETMRWRAACLKEVQAGVFSRLYIDVNTRSTEAQNTLCQPFREISRGGERYQSIIQRVSDLQNDLAQTGPMATTARPVRLDLPGQQQQVLQGEQHQITSADSSPQASMPSESHNGHEACPSDRLIIRKEHGKHKPLDEIALPFTMPLGWIIPNTNRGESADVWTSWCGRQIGEANLDNVLTDWDNGLWNKNGAPLAPLRILEHSMLRSFVWRWGGDGNKMRNLMYWKVLVYALHRRVTGGPRSQSDVDGDVQHAPMNLQAAKEDLGRVQKDIGP